MFINCALVKSQQASSSQCIAGETVKAASKIRHSHHFCKISFSSSAAMATVCTASQTGVVLSSSFHTSAPSTRLKSSAASAVPHRQEQNGSLKVTASAEERCSRREAMTVVGGAGLAGLGLLLLPVGSAEAAQRGKPGVRRKIREELDKLKEEAVKTTEEVKQSVQGAAKEVTDNVANK